MDELLQKNEYLKRMVEIGLPIAESDPLSGTSSAVYRLARSVLRKNIMRVQAVFILNTYERMSDCALEIARNIIEDAISVSFILSDDEPEKLALEFFEYRFIQAKQDLDYYSKIPGYLGENLEKDRSDIDREYKRVLLQFPDFINPNGQPRHSWSKDGVEGMAGKLVKRKLYEKHDVRNMLRVYQLGSRKVHFNPRDLLNYYDNDSWDKASLRALEYSIKGSAAGLASFQSKPRH